MEAENRPFVTAMSTKMRATVVSLSNGVIIGELQSRFFDEPCKFTSLIQMIRKMEGVFDTKKFPQSSVKLRSFAALKQNNEQRNAERRDSMTSNNLELTIPDDQETRKCTFEISVKFRQNASWQGEILWAEKNMRQNFRSVLEMLKLMDEALTEGSEVTSAPHWKDA